MNVVEPEGYLTFEISEAGDVFLLAAQFIYENLIRDVQNGNVCT